MAMRFDGRRRPVEPPEGLTCPSCGRTLEVVGLVQPSDLLKAHLRYSCRGTGARA